MQPPIIAQRRGSGLGRIVGALLLTLALAACSSSKPTASTTGKNSASVRSNGAGNVAGACATMRSLVAIAAKVKTANPNDPATFSSVIDTAVRDYVKAFEILRKQLPDEQAATVGSIEALLQSHSFVEATNARAKIDNWASDNC